jgi:adenylyltransferase/sulfurtransferase
MFFQQVPTITVEELKARWDAGNPPLLLDVREAREIATAAFPMPIVSIPVQQLPQRIGELSKDAEIVCACRSGGRSAAAAKLLLSAGFTNVRNLEGGIIAWSQRIDPSIPLY